LRLRRCPPPARPSCRRKVVAAAALIKRARVDAHTESIAKRRNCPALGEGLKNFRHLEG
jgi:hypothetical protein